MKDLEQQIKSVAFRVVDDVLVQIQIASDTRLGLGGASLLARRAVVVAGSRGLHGVWER